MKSLCIAIDFDDTFTADPKLWSAFITDAQDKGHRVLCVTSRRESEENANDITEAFEASGITLPIIFCNMGSKLWTMDKRGTEVDIWIDDAPHVIVNGY